MPGGHVQVRINTQKLEDAIRDQLADKMVTLGEEAVEEIRQTISTMAPPHSEAGTPPHKMTGELSESVYSEVVLVGNMPKLVVGAKAKHAVPLELGTRRMVPRPFLLPGLYWLARRAKQVLGLK